MDRTTEDTRAVLRAAKEIHSERHGAQTFTPGTHLPLEEAGRRAGFGANTLRYYDVIEDLEFEGAIEWAASARYARGDKHYVITERGLEMLRMLGDDLRPCDWTSRRTNGKLLDSFRKGVAAEEAVT